ncbi:MAG: ankyrin repeat domain-containing protein [Candidatus Delongbacteria bacterium]|nr:ankyrin repeat domain-containing protein [Candidatus Delongbacteria bacterium]
MKKNILTLILAVVLTTFMVSCSSDEDKLFRAIKKGDLKEVQSLVQSGVSVLMTNKNGLSPLEVARLNNQDEIANYIFEEIKLILDKETRNLLDTVFKEELRKLKEIETERKKQYELYLESNDKLLSYMSEDVRLTENIISEQEKYFRSHQEYIKIFIDSKVDLIEAILKELVRRDRLYNVDSKEARHIVNVSIMFTLGKL